MAGCLRRGGEGSRRKHRLAVTTSEGVVFAMLDRALGAGFGVTCAIFAVGDGKVRVTGAQG